ncbi:MAG: AAA family ATPase [Sphaerochaetaceae bacterium]|nr:AAA family ATPase [Sphaerochaetaceae bacterium]
MGVLLTGDKGNGKSLTAKMICQKSGLPVIMVTQPFVGEAYQNFLGTMKQEVVVFYDEFEKVYPEEDKKQEEFLPILDGIFQSKKLFLFTTNSLEINQFLMNRPGRIRYLRKYRGLEKDVVKEVIKDKLEDKDREKELMELVNILSNISMDVLLHIIEEMNLYNESPLESVRMLNVQVEHSEFDVLMYIKGKRHIAKIHYNPLTTKYIWVSYKEVDERDNVRWRYFEKESDEFDIQAVDGEFIFQDKEGNKLIFTASKPFEFSL